MFEIVSRGMFTQTHDTMQPHIQLRCAQSPPPILYDELMVEILSRLPVKSLLRFRCVCKWWKSMIFDSQFVKLHLHRSASNADFAHLRLTSTPYYKNFGVRYRDNPPSFIHYSCLVVGSCNGLIGLVAYESFGVDMVEYWVHLWNPATRFRSEKSPSFYVHEAVLDRFNAHTYGFGYDNLTDTYKVVVVFGNRFATEDSHKTTVKAYSIGDNCWRNIQSFPVAPWGTNRGEFLSGTLNWIGARNFTHDFERGRTFPIDQLFIVSLDLGKETYTQFLVPHGLDEIPYFEPTLGVLRDCLCVSHDYKKTHFVVWQMKEFGVEKSWTQLVNVSYEYLQTSCLEFSQILLLYVSENGDVVMMSYYDEPRKILYNPRDNRVERYEIPDDINSTYREVYVESLVQPY